jgi:hypothetical protein
MPREPKGEKNHADVKCNGTGRASQPGNQKKPRGHYRG